jgi:hypothetical protein
MGGARPGGACAWDIRVLSAMRSLRTFCVGPGPRVKCRKVLWDTLHRPTGGCKLTVRQSCLILVEISSKPLASLYIAL